MIGSFVPRLRSWCLWGLPLQYHISLLVLTRVFARAAFPRWNRRVIPASDNGNFDGSNVCSSFLSPFDFQMPTGPIRLLRLSSSLSYPFSSPDTSHFHTLFVPFSFLTPRHQSLPLSAIINLLLTHQNRQIHYQPNLSEKVTNSVKKIELERFFKKSWKAC